MDLEDAVVGEDTKLSADHLWFEFMAFTGQAFEQWVTIVVSHTPLVGMRGHFRTCLLAWSWVCDLDVCVGDAGVQAHLGAVIIRLSISTAHPAWLGARVLVVPALTHGLSILGHRARLAGVWAHATLAHRIACLSVASEALMAGACEGALSVGTVSVHRAWTLLTFIQVDAPVVAEVVSLRTGTHEGATGVHTGRLRVTAQVSILYTLINVDTLSLVELVTRAAGTVVRALHIGAQRRLGIPAYVTLQALVTVGTCLSVPDKSNLAFTVVAAACVDTLLMFSTGSFDEFTFVEVAAFSIAHFLIALVASTRES